MKKIFFLVSVFSVISLNAATNATIIKGQKAEEIVPNSEVVRLKDFTKVPNYVKFKKGKELPLANLEKWLKNFYTSEGDHGIRLIRKETGSLGYTHYRYQQTMNGIPVELSAFIAHTKNGLIVSMNGEMFSGINASTNASISESGALNSALNSIGANIYMWEAPGAEDHLKLEQEDPNATYYPSGQLVLINNKGNIEDKLVLAYKFNIYAQEPDSRSEVYVDANTGAIVWEQDMIHEADVVGTATTVYSGSQTITCDNASGPFRLREAGRGNGIRTFTSGLTTTFPTTDITNGSATWAGPESGLDAHWGAEMTYDYYLNYHGRNSIDGNGFQLISYVHYGNNYANASWDGSRMRYGDGSGNNTPFTALDITGHEVTHGLTSNTAALIYNAESGALNESFSDIFGISIDIINRSPAASTKWKLGDDLGFTIRDMIDPNSKGDPDTYFGTNWASLTGGDNGGVHTNSGVQNYWFVLLSEMNSALPGMGTGTNDSGHFYTVNPIGITKAGQIAFRNLTVYLTQSSGYFDSRFYSIQSAEDLFGPCSPEVIETTNAWHAVGVGPVFSAATITNFDAPAFSSCIVPFPVSFNNTTINGTSYTWDFGDGDTSTLAAPTHSYLSNGTYTVQLIADGGVCGSVDTLIRTAYINVSTPTAPITTDDMICPNSAATLIASGSGVLNWYTAATGGPIINTGTTYTTPLLAASTTYYVDNVVASPIQSLGKPNNNGGGANYNNQQHLFFDVFQPMTIISVEVYPSVAGNRTIELRDNQSNVVASTTVNIGAGPGPLTVPLNFTVQPGTDYELGLAGSTANINMYRNNAGTNYPYSVSGLASITRSSAGTAPTGYYYFFYNWDVKAGDCVSPRTPVTANVQICTGIDELNGAGQVTSFLNGSKNVELSLTNLELGSYNLVVLNALGQVVTSNQLNVSSTQQTETVNMYGKAKGLYYVKLYNISNNFTVKLVK